MQRKAPAESTEATELIVPVTSDRGLCGSINSGIMRDLRDHIKDVGREKVDLFLIGEKGTAAAYRPYPDMLKECVQNMSTPLNYA